MKRDMTSEFNVIMSTDSESGNVVREFWTKSGLAHRDNNMPSWQEWDAKTGIKVYEAFYKDGVLHRIDGPAVTAWDAKTGLIIEETWAQYGCKHRDGDNPASWIRDPEFGTMVMEQFWFSGVQHRRNGPAEIWREAETGNIVNQEHYFMGMRIPSPKMSDGGFAP